jgi:methylated-DNA-[protein]-cysteine S-methyltransferase
LRRQLDEYFAGSRRRFEFPIDWRLMHGFGRDVLRVTAHIPYGKVSTYGDVAVRTGRPKASRAVGNALGANPMPIVIPCHRVVRTGGGLGGYTGGVQRKERLLQLEGGAPR